MSNWLPNMPRQQFIYKFDYTSLCIFSLNHFIKYSQYELNQYHKCIIQTVVMSLRTDTTYSVLTYLWILTYHSLCRLTSVVRK